MDFEAKPETVEKVINLLLTHLDTVRMTPGEASKLRGQLQWTSLGMCGKVGRGGVWDLSSKESIRILPHGL